MKGKMLLKKVIALLMTTVLIFGMVNMALATDRVQYSSEKDFEYVTEIIDEKIGIYEPGTEVAVITRYVGNGGDVVIPRTLGGYPVAAINDLAFSVVVGRDDEPYQFSEQSAKIKSVVIPDSVFFIGAGAFMRFGATNVMAKQILKMLFRCNIANPEIEITVPSTVEFIGPAAFGCITIVEISDSSLGSITETPQQTINYKGTAEKWNSICDQTDIGDECRYDDGGIVIDFDANLNFNYLCDCDGVTDNESESVDPTCTTDGYITYICDCGTKTSKTIIPSINHSNTDSNNLCDTCNTRIYEENGYKYVIINDEATIVCYTGAGGHIIIPDTLGGYPVVKIDDSAFYIIDNHSQNGDISTAKKIKSVVIPDSVKEIGMFAFLRIETEKAFTAILPDIEELFGDPRITVTVPSSVEYIGPYAFGCFFLNFKNTTVEKIPKQTVLFEGTKAQWNEVYDKYNVSGNISDLDIDLGDIDFDYEFKASTNIHYSCDAVVDNISEKSPTCTESGYYTQSCDCRTTYLTETFPAIGHTDHNENNYCDVCYEFIGIPDYEETTDPSGSETTDPSEDETTEPEYVTPSYTLSTEGIAAPGQKIKVYLSIENNPGIIALKNSVSYDSSVFTLESVENLDVLNGFIPPSPDTNSPYTLAWSHGTATENNTSEGQIAALTFTVNEDAPVGDYEFSVTHTEGWSYDFESISFENASATVSVINVDKGDVNADGNTDLRDSVLLARYLANWKVEIVSFASDIDEDGEVTDRDSILLNRYLAGWNVEEMKKPSSDQ